MATLPINVFEETNLEDSTEINEVEISEIADATELTRGYDFRGTYLVRIYEK